MQFLFILYLKFSGTSITRQTMFCEHDFSYYVSRILNCNIFSFVSNHFYTVVLKFVFGFIAVDLYLLVPQYVHCLVKKSCRKST